MNIKMGTRIVQTILLHFIENSHLLVKYFRPGPLHKHIYTYYLHMCYCVKRHRPALCNEADNLEEILDGWMALGPLSPVMSDYQSVISISVIPDVCS